MKLTPYLFVFIILCFSVLASPKVGDYPYLFVHDNLFDAKYVIADESSSVDVVTATILSTNLARYDDVKTAVGTTHMDSEISDITKINAIVIGNPCISRSAAVLEGNPSDCYEGLEPSTGYIKMFNHGNKIQMLITGISDEDRQVIAKRLAKGSYENSDRSIVSVKTGSGSKLPAISSNVVFHSVNDSEDSFSSVVNSSETDYVVVEEPVEAAPSEVLEVKKKKEVKPYERVEVYLPPKKGFFSRFFSWVASLFGF